MTKTARTMSNVLVKNRRIYFVTPEGSISTSTKAAAKRELADIAQRLPKVRSEAAIGTLNIRVQELRRGIELCEANNIK